MVFDIISDIFCDISSGLHACPSYTFLHIYVFSHCRGLRVQIPAGPPRPSPLIPPLNQINHLQKLLTPYHSPYLSYALRDKEAYPKTFTDGEGHSDRDPPSLLSNEGLELLPDPEEVPQESRRELLLILGNKIKPSDLGVSRFYLHKMRAGLRPIPDSILEKLQRKPCWAWPLESKATGATSCWRS